MAAKKSTKKSKSISTLSAYTQLKDAAQLLTMSSAVLYGLLGVAVWLAPDNAPSWSGDAGNSLLVATMVGGMSMGLLYLADIARK